MRIFSISSALAFLALILITLANEPKNPTNSAMIGKVAECLYSGLLRRVYFID